MTGRDENWRSKVMVSLIRSERRMLSEAHRAYTGGDYELGDAIIRFVNRKRLLVRRKCHFEWNEDERRLEVMPGQADRRRRGDFRSPV